MAVAREMVRIRQGSHVCEPFDRSYHVSNWCAAWNDVDFGPIVKGEGKGAGGKPKLLVLGQSGERSSPLRRECSPMDWTTIPGLDKDST